jgi:hypothetical protein
MCQGHMTGYVSEPFYETNNQAVYRLDGNCGSHGNTFNELGRVS